MRSLAHRPGKVTYWAPGNDEILEGGGSFSKWGTAEGIWGSGIISAGEYHGWARSSGEKETAVFPV